MRGFEILNNAENGASFYDAMKKEKKTFADYAPGEVPKKETQAKPTKTTESKPKNTVKKEEKDDFLEGFNFFEEEKSPSFSIKDRLSDAASIIGSFTKNEPKTKHVPPVQMPTFPTPSSPQSENEQEVQFPEIWRGPYRFEDAPKITKLPFYPGDKPLNVNFPGKIPTIPKKDDFLEGFNYYNEDSGVPTEKEKHYIPDDVEMSPKYGNVDIGKVFEDLKNAYENSVGGKISSAALNVAKRAYDVLGKTATFVVDANNPNNWKLSAEEFNPTGIANNLWKILNRQDVAGDLSNWVLDVYDVQDTYNKLPAISNLHKMRADKNRAENENIDLSEYYKTDKNGNVSYDYITNQQKGSVGKLKYGSKTMSENGCGVIAAYNSLLTLGMPKDVREIAHELEGDGQILDGIFGTKPEAIKDYFEKNNCTVETLKGNDILTKETPDADTYVLVYWNNSEAVSDGAHFVSVKKQGDKYRMYNFGNDWKYIESDTIAQYLTNNNYIPIVMYNIKRR